MVILMQGAFVLISIVPALSIAPLTPIYMQEWQRSLTDVALLVPYPHAPDNDVC